MCYEPDLWHTLYRDDFSIQTSNLRFKHQTKKGNRLLDECLNENEIFRFMTNIQE